MGSTPNPEHQPRGRMTLELASPSSWMGTHDRLDQKAKQLHPSAPQKLLRSATGSLADHAVAWSWPWMSQSLAQLQLSAIFCKPSGLVHFGSPQAAYPPKLRTGDQSGIAGGGAVWSRCEKSPVA